MIPLLETLEASGPANYLRGSFYLYPLLNAAHILAIGALVTSALLMDLRILGFGRSVPVELVIGHLRPVAILALIVAVITGLLLFSVRPLDYVDNPAFRLKLLVLVVAIVNAVAFSFLQYRLAVQNMGLRVLAILSLVLWPCALAAGRFIGFLA